MRESNAAHPMRALALAGLLFWGLGANPAQAQTLPVVPYEVPGEGLDGTLLPAPIGTQDSPLIRLDADELQALGASRSETPQYAGTLPPILVAVEGGYYEQVATTVSAPVDHRRRSMSSRGAHMTPAPATRTVYKTVYRRQSRQLDISPIIHKCAQKYQLDPWLIRGVIEVESAFRPSVSSHAGAGGLMQLMPGTAAYLGCRDRFNPEQNIDAGARYLRMMLDRFGDYDLAIAAYNAGPGNVERYGGIPPFAETRNYVVKVKRAWQWRPGNSR